MSRLIGSAARRDITPKPRGLIHVDARVGRQSEGRTGRVGRAQFGGHVQCRAPTKPASHPHTRPNFEPLSATNSGLRSKEQSGADATHGLCGVSARGTPAEVQDYFSVARSRDKSARMAVRLSRAMYTGVAIAPARIRE